MKVLALESSAKAVSVAVCENGMVLAQDYQHTGLTHSVTMMPLLENMLEKASIKLEDCDIIAVAAGPGSFTGLRIGVSFAKGMCYALDIPLIAIGSLDALTEVAREDYDAGILDIEEEEWAKAKLCPLVDARRMEVYAEVFDNEGKALTDVVAEVVTEESFKEWRKDKFVIFGNGAKKCTELLSDAIFVDIAPSARGIVRLAEESFKAQKFEDLAYFEPFYLKEFLVIPSKKKLL